jgi:hypothetical protein
MSPLPDDPALAAAFEAFPAAPRARLLAVRDLVLETAAANPVIGPLVESLKWGEPAYRPAKVRVGTTVRLGISPRAPQACAVFVHCKTTLMASYRELYPDSFGFEGERALILDLNRPLPTEALRHCLSLALTYHARPAALA